MDDLEILLALHHQPGIGPRTIKRLLEHWPSLKELWFEFNNHSLRTKLPSAILSALNNLPWHAVTADLEWSKSNYNHLITWYDKDYPRLLRHIPTPPAVLYLKGQLEVLNNPMISIVGTRHPTAYGKTIAREWGAEFANSGFTLVSGLALGIDTLVHQACIESDTPTIAVLGNGLNSIYPLSNRFLGQAIIENGLLISEFPLNYPPKAGHFPQRNRIISGLTLLTLIVESAEKSGTLITAAHAMEQNRELLVVPGSIYSKQSMGCNKLIQQGARPVLSCQEVLQCMQFITGVCV